MHKLSLPLFLSLAVACGATIEPAVVAPMEEPVLLPTVEGVVIYDRPISQSSEVVQDLWIVLSSAAEGERPVCRGSMDEVMSCTREQFGPWASARVDELHAWRAAAEALTGSEKSFADFGFGYLAEQLVAGFTSTQITPSLDEELEALLRNSLMDGAAPIALQSRESYLLCADAELESLRETCVSRAESLRELAERDVTRAPAVAAAPPAPELPAECARTVRAAAPVLDPPNARRPLTIALMYRGNLVAGAEREALLTEIHQRVSAHVAPIPVVPLREVLTAEAQVESRRMTSRGPICGQAPPLPLILQRRHPNLALAEVLVTSDLSGGEQLEVSFYQPQRGSQWQDAPERLAAAIPGPGDNPLSDAANALAPSPGGGALLGMLVSGPNVVALPDESVSPWLRIPQTLEDDEMRLRIAECAARGSAVSVNASWSVTRTGEARNVTLEGSTMPEGQDGDAVIACITDIIENTPFPCTRSGRTERVQAVLCTSRAE